MKASDFDLVHLFNAEDRTRRWRAEHENAAARLELAQRDENAARLLSQHEPVASAGVDREKLRLLLAYLRHGDMKRLERELGAP